MFSLEGVHIDIGGLIRSALLIVVIFFATHKRLLPHFVLPHQRISRIWYVQQFLLGCLVLCLVLFPLDIQLVTGSKTIQEEQQRLIVLLDVSLSMTADDVLPSRFSVAKDVISTLVHTLEHTEVALIAFSGLPLLEIPFTRDTSAFLSHISDLSLADFPPTSLFVGTALGDALLLAQDMVSLNEPTSVLLITDGDNSQGLHPLRVIDMFKNNRIRIHTFAIGEEAYQVGIDTSGNEVYAYIDLALLGDIAHMTQGTFMHITPENIQDMTHSIETSLSGQKDVLLVEQYLSLNDRLVYILLYSLALYLVIKILLILQLSKLFRG